MKHTISDQKQSICAHKIRVVDENIVFFVAGIDYISDNRDVKYHLIYICHRALKARSGVSLRYLIVPWTPGPLDLRDPEGIIRGQDPDSLPNPRDLFSFSKIELSCTRNPIF